VSTGNIGVRSWSRTGCLSSLEICRGEDRKPQWFMPTPLRHKRVTLTDELTPQLLLFSGVFATGIGIFFGYHPSRKASELIPIEALRYEYARRRDTVISGRGPFLSHRRRCVITVECHVVAHEEAVSDREASRIDFSFASEMPRE